MITITENDKKYWQYEYDVVAKYILPLLVSWGLNLKGKTLLDVGCGDGGGIAAFYEAGCKCKGFDIEPRRVELANTLKDNRNYNLLVGNIYEEKFPYSDEKFDFIVLHDVIEHLVEKETVFKKLINCLNPGGRILITFPPYFSAYGAHQQLLNNKFLKLPYVHLLGRVYAYFLRQSKNEHEEFREEIFKLMKMKMGLNVFTKLVNSCNLEIEKEKRYIIGPNHIRFGLKPISARIFGKIPYLNEIIINGVIYLLKVKERV